MPVETGQSICSLHPARIRLGRNRQTISGRRFPRSPGRPVFSDDKASQSTTNRRIPATIETQPWLVRTVPDSATRQISPKSGRVPGYLADISTEFVSDHYALASVFRQNSAGHLVTGYRITDYFLRMIADFISPIALAGFRPFGQALVQFMIV